MQITCPACETRFSVPDKALGADGRTLKCARCGHKWFQSPVVAAPPPPPPPPPPPSFEDEEPEPAFSFSPRMDEDEPPIDFTKGGGLNLSSLSGGHNDFDLDEPPVPHFGSNLGERGEPADLDLDTSLIRPVPDVFADPPKGKKGTLGLWILVLLFILAGAGGSAYYFQDKLVALWPGAHDLLQQAGLRREKLGDGLELRNAGTSERFVQNDAEVLIVRGIVANVSDRERKVPLMRLELMDKDNVVVQDKTQPPPAASLDPGGTAGFRFVVERPNPNAVKALVVFAEPAEAK